VLAERSDDNDKRDDAKAPAGRDRADIRRAAAARRAETAPLRQRVTAAEAAMKKLTQAIEKIDAALGDGALFANDPAKAAQLAKERAAHVAALAQTEDEWLAATAAYEDANAEP
jgi:ATP-binding cassette subfamily F protein 3